MLELPLELVGEVASYLQTKDLYNLSLVCSFCRHGAERSLYHTITCDLEASSFRYNEHRLVSRLLQLIIDRPELARHVKRVVLVSFEPDYAYDWYLGMDKELLDPARYSSFIEAAKAVGLIKADTDITQANERYKIQREKGALSPSALFARNHNDHDTWMDQWIAELLLGALEPQIHLLLSLVPGVESIDAGPVPTSSPNLPWNIINTVPHGFKRLRRLTLRNINRPWPQLMPLLFLPTLVQAELEYLHNGALYYTETPEMRPRPMCSVRTLYLKNNNFVTSSTVKFLSRFHKLTTLSFDGGCHFFNVQYGPEDIFMRVQQSSSTLKYLQLIGGHFCKVPTLFFDGLQQLTVLSVSFCILEILDEPSRRFPRSLQAFSLKFDWCSPPTFITFSPKFCSNKLLSIAIECPELKVISLEAKPREPCLSPRTELRQKFKRVTTRLDFQTLNTSDPTRVFRQLVDEFGGEKHK